MIARLNDELNHGLAQQDVEEKLASVGAETVGTTPTELAKLVRAESEKEAEQAVPGERYRLSDVRG